MHMEIKINHSPSNDTNKNITIRIFPNIQGRICKIFLKNPEKDILSEEDKIKS